MIEVYPPNLIEPYAFTPDSSRDTFEQLQALVGGYVAVLPSPNSEEIQLLGNEDARDLQLPQNQYWPEYFGTIILLTPEDFLK